MAALLIAVCCATHLELLIGLRRVCDVCMPSHCLVTLLSGADASACPPALPAGARQLFIGDVETGRTVFQPLYSFIAEQVGQQLFNMHP